MQLRLEFFIKLVLLNCHLRGSHDETVDHLLTNCSIIAESYYQKFHDVVAKIIHWELANRGGFECATK